MPKLCQNQKCCGKYLFFAEQGQQKYLLPLKKVDVKSELRGSTAVTNVELTYLNPHGESPLECTYVFPLEKTTLLSKFEAVIDDRVIETRVLEKEKAQEKYEDAVASGNAAVLAERSKKKEQTMTIKLGNLLPQQSATLKIQLVHLLEIVGGFFNFSLPIAFYPDYRRHGVRQADKFVYEFGYEVCIISDTRISNVNIPDLAEIVEKDEHNRRIVVRSDQTSR